jgi:hypothetical protein
MATDYSLTTAVFRGLTFGRGTPRLINPDKGIAGWLALPGYTMDKQPRFGGHGSANAPVHHEGRTVVVSGFVDQRPDRDLLVAEFRRIMVPNVDPLTEEPLTVTVAGQTRTVFGKLVAADLDMSPRWGQGSFPYKFMVDCSSAFKLGAHQRSVLQMGSPGAGVTPPLTPPVTLPAGVANGSGVIYNDGTAPADVIYELAGSQSVPGVANLTTGRTIRVNLNMGDSDLLVIDTGNGTITLNGESRFPDALSDLMVDMRLAVGANNVQATGQPGATGPRTLTVDYYDTDW